MVYSAPYPPISTSKMLSRFMGQPRKCVAGVREMGWPDGPKARIRSG
jgi:hypothetical protein